MNQSINSLFGATFFVKMDDKTPMFNAFNINFYCAGLEDADVNGTFIQCIVILATTSMVLCIRDPYSED
jgi:hypothetical protein